MFAFVFSCNNSFCLTGGTVLHRFYYHYRNSNNVDYFCSQTVIFRKFIHEILQKIEHFSDEFLTLDFHRLMVNNQLQIDFANDKVIGRRKQYA
jgi:hypothetical protein